MHSEHGRDFDNFNIDSTLTGDMLSQMGYPFLLNYNPYLMRGNLCALRGSLSPKGGNVCPLRGNPRATEGNLCPMVVNPCPMRENLCSLRHNPCPMRGNLCSMGGNLRPVGRDLTRGALLITCTGFLQMRHEMGMIESVMLWQHRPGVSKPIGIIMFRTIPLPGDMVTPRAPRAHSIHCEITVNNTW